MATTATFSKKDGIPKKVSRNVELDFFSCALHLAGEETQVEVWLMSMLSYETDVAHLTGE